MTQLAAKFSRHDIVIRVEKNRSCQVDGASVLRFTDWKAQFFGRLSDPSNDETCQCQFRRNLEHNSHRKSFTVGQCCCTGRSMGRCFEKR